MLQKITEPQALYSKAPTPGESVHTSLTTPPKKKKLNWKIIGSILTVCLVAVVGVAGVLIAQRQQADQSPVAPNAPESKPSAQIPEDPNRCTLSFNISPAATPTPPPATVGCISKTVKIRGAATNLASNAVVKAGDVLEFTINVNQPIDSLGLLARVVVTDTLSSQLQFNEGSSTDLEDYDPARNAAIIELPGGVRASTPKTEAIKYTATVKANSTVGAITSNSVVVTSNNTAAADSSCKVQLTLQAAPAGVASCLKKEAFKPDGSQYGTGVTASALTKRGDIITYKITVRANAQTGGPVVVKDVLPTALAYQAGSARIGTATPTAAQFTATGQNLTFNLGTMASTTANREYVLTYKAAVKADAQIAAFNNSVTVSTNGTASTTPAACKVTLQVAPVGLAVCKAKEAFSDYGGTKIANDSIVQKGTTFAYKVTVEATETTAGSVVVVDTLPASLEFVESRNNELTLVNGKLTATIPTLGATTATRTKVFEYKVKVKDTAAAGKFENAVTVTTNSNTAQADSCLATLHVPYQCNSTCTTDSQCVTANSGYVCSTDAGNKCRVASNQGSETCQGTTPEYSCNSSCENDTQCKTRDSNYVCAPTSEGNRCRHKDYSTRASCDAPPSTATPTPTPAIGCNDRCTSNADCSNPSHICYTTGDGSQLCRLDTNPASNTCSNPATPGTPTTPVATQPNLPEELPQTGPEDWVNWLKAGLITLGVGAALLLLL
jgi:fimbrial isopeptide formation D2 family protein